MQDLITLIETLRGENGCPWDRQQTPASMILYLIEEAYELYGAIESNQPDAVKEELGDVLFQVLFIARLYEEMDQFNIRDVVDFSVEKMTHRHPHVFKNKGIESAEDVKKQWHRIKREEKSTNEYASILDSIPQKMPALMRAYRMSERAARSGFDWDNISGVIDKVKEEWHEFLTALNEKDQNENHLEHVALEFGDILFTLVNVARFADIHPEAALTKAVTKFENRFKQMEELIRKKGKTLDSVSIEEMNRLWEKVKRQNEY